MVSSKNFWHGISKVILYIDKLWDPSEVSRIRLHFSVTSLQPLCLPTHFPEKILTRNLGCVNVEMVSDKGKKSRVVEKVEDDENHAADIIDSELVLSIEKLQEVQDELEKVSPFLAFPSPFIWVHPCLHV